MKMTDESERNVFRSLAQRAVPFLRDEGEKYDDDGSNEPLELAREIESAMASSPSHESALVSANSAFDGGLEAANLDDAKAFAALETARGSLHWTLADTVAKDMLDAMAYLAGRLVADQQKGGGEVGLPGSLITHRYVWRKALELAVFSADPAHAEKWNRELAAYDQTFDRLWQLIEAEMKWPDPQPSIPAPAKLDSLNRQLDKLCSWKHLMSYNEAYFGEPEGELKATVYEIDRCRSVCGQCGYRAGSRKGCTLCSDISAQQDGKASGGEVVTAAMVRMAKHLCPLDLSSPEQWRWMAAHLNSSIRAKAPPHADQETQG